MNKIVRTALFAVVTMFFASTLKAQYTPEQLGELPFGYNKAWTARTLFNAEGGYKLENIKSWPVLYEALADDKYTISLPMPTPNWWNGQLQFKTPITLTAQHKYRLRVSLLASMDMTVTVLLRENENDANEMMAQDVQLVAGQIKGLNATNLDGKDIADLKLVFHIMCQRFASELQVSGISLYDLTDRKELWTGTSYYNYCYYGSGDRNTRQPDMKIEGRHETGSWMQPDFDASQWAETEMPVGNEGYINGLRTIWPGGDNTNYWIRREFELAEVKGSTAYYLRVCHDDMYWIYVNGHLVDEDEGWTTGKQYVEIEVPSAFLRPGKNVIAVNQRQTYGGKFFDCAMHIQQNAYEESDPDADYSKLQVSEVTVANIDQTLDFSWNYGGWVELYNNSSKRIALSGMYISDDASQLNKAQLSAKYGVIPAYGYKCIFFDHHPSDGGQYGDNAKYQIPFKLQADGGTLYLSLDGKTPLLTVDYPASIARCSWARKDVDGAEWSYNAAPTPGAANSSKWAMSRLDAPVVSEPSQLLKVGDMKPLVVRIPEGCTLRYTMDGSTPTLQNGYTDKQGNFSISSTCTYRFRLFRDGYLPSPVVTRSYIYKDKDYYLPVISVVTAKEHLYDDSIGIYVDGVNGIEGRNHGKSNRNMDWQRPAHVNIIMPDGTNAVNQECNICISGGWSRHFMPASIKLKASKVFEGVNSFDYPFFRYKSFNKYKQLLVRNGGNDNDNELRGRVRDAITQQVLISNGFYVDAQDYQPAHLFFNGTYIGLLNLREPNNRFNGTANYGYDDDAMDAFEYSNGYYQMAGTKDAFNEWYTLAQGAADDAVYDQLLEKVDMDEVINYWAAVTYIGCSDWIMNNNNVKGYRSLPDGKFHLTVLDQDWGWANTRGVESVNNQYGNELLAIYNNMKKNERFRRQFVNAYCILHGSVFTPERCQRIGDSIVALVEPALKWEGRKPANSFYEQRNNMISESARNNRIDALRNAYGLNAPIKAKISANIPQARLMLDKQPIPEAKLNGVLFPPVTLTASAPDGYIFKGWANNRGGKNTLFARDASWRYYDQGDPGSNDWRQPNFDDSAWAEGAAPLGYFTGGTRDYNTTLNFGPDAANKIIAYYFRRHVQLDETPLAGDEIKMPLTVDDGMVLYVNGQEVMRRLMPEGEIGYYTYATTHAPDNPDSETITIPASFFHKGDNVIAVEVHNNVPGSTDIYWAASLEMTTNTPIVVERSNQIKITEQDDVELTALFERIPESELIATGKAPVRINEVSAGNDIYINEYGKRDDWVELYNATDQDIDLAGMFLSDKTNDPKKYEIQPVDGITTKIPAGGHLVVWASKRDAQSQLHAPFKLDNADGCFVSLQAADGSWRDVLRYNEHDSKQTFGRYPDGGNDTYTMSAPTIRRANMLCTSDFEMAQLQQGQRSDSVKHTFELQKGWNWFAHNMASAVPARQLTAKTTELRSQDASLVLQENGQWAGDLNLLKATQGYKVQATESHEVAFNDRPFDLQGPATVQKGWNWVGSPLLNATSLQAALGNYIPTEGDMLVGRDAFAFFTEGTWQGTLRSVAPGQAYMLKSGLQQAFQWNALTNVRRASRRYAARSNEPESSWRVDTSLYPDVQPLVAKISQGGSYLSDERYQLGAFVGDECRGVATWEDGRLFLLIYGDAAEPIQLRIMDAEGTEWGCKETFTFSALDAKGTFLDPIILNLDEASDVLRHSMPRAAATSVRYYSVDGRLISKPTQGISIRQTHYSDGRIVTEKVMR